MAWLPSKDNSVTTDTKSALPSDSTVEKLNNLEVKSEDGSSVKFSSLVNDSAHPRVLTVFIRHFFCGFCESYIRALTKDLPPATLASLSPPTKLVLIGCGDPSLIASYKKRTACPYDLYADPTRATYDALGFANTLANTGKPDYADKSFASTVWSSFTTNLMAGSKIFSGGKTSQNGGELIWVDGKLTFIYRMASTVDHMSIPDLKKQLEA
ncbi:hypothetical protein K461DRAFT_265105 [Myriangium duriaei CBS 260.36]|uniref:Thioredoxin domain-containing protein n=1 Tax=Myriangium duriaei CBS 260.36 TaxID=1168546 RepID=A0A9P4J517_9PEZI|nr:hypothetical protein K461DRAFT_265105 [Myriangium duriaei CBS 260.36]